MNIKKHFFVFSLLISSFAFGMRDADGDVAMQDSGTDMGELEFRCIKTFTFARTTQVKISPDKRFFLAQFGDDGLQLFDFEGRPKWEPRLNNIYYCKFSPDSRSLLVLYNNVVLQLIDTKSGMPKWALRLDNISCDIYRFDARPLFANYSNGVLQLFDTKSGMLKRALRLDDISCNAFRLDRSDIRPLIKGFLDCITFCFSSDGKSLLVKYSNGVLQLLDTKSGMPKWTRRLDNISSCVFSPDSRSLLVVFEDSLQLFDVETGTPKLTRRLDNTYFRTFSSGGKSLLVEYSNGVLQLLDTKSGMPKWTRRLDNISRSEFSPDSRFLLVIFEDESLQVFDVETGETKPLQELKRPMDSCFSSDSRFLLVIFEDESLQVFDVETGEAKLPQELRIDTSKYNYCFSSDSRYFAANFEGAGFQLFDLENRRTKWEEPLKNVLLFDLSSDSKNLVVLCEDEGESEILQMFDIKSGRRRWIRPLKNVIKAEFSLDGRFLYVTFEDDSFQLYDAESGKMFLQQSSICYCYTQPYGNRLIFVSHSGENRLINIYDLPTENSKCFRKNLLRSTIVKKDADDCMDVGDDAVPVVRREGDGTDQKMDTQDDQESPVKSKNSAKSILGKRRREEFEGQQGAQQDQESQGKTDRCHEPPKKRQKLPGLADLTGTEERRRAKRRRAGQPDVVVMPYFSE